MAGANAASPVSGIHWRKAPHKCSAAVGSPQGLRLTAAAHQTRSSAGWEELSGTGLLWQAACSQNTLAFLDRACFRCLVFRQRNQRGAVSYAWLLSLLPHPILAAPLRSWPVPPIPLQWAVNEVQSYLWRVLSFSHQETRCEMRYTYPFLFYCWRKTGFIACSRTPKWHVLVTGTTVGKKESDAHILFRWEQMRKSHQAPLQRG